MWIYFILFFIFDLMRRAGAPPSPVKNAEQNLHDSAKARFFYQGVFALRKLYGSNKSAPKTTTIDTRKR